MYLCCKKNKESEEDTESLEFVELDNDQPAPAIISPTQDTDGTHSIDQVDGTSEGLKPVFWTQKT